MMTPLRLSSWALRGGAEGSPDRLCSLSTVVHRHETRRHLLPAGIYCGY